MSQDHRDGALDVFFSYSHEDEALRDELEIHLAALKHQGKVRTWHDRKISAGLEWAGQIDDNLHSADIILLLVSPPFIASAYCWDVEMADALERHKDGEARVIPIILRHADWRYAPLGKLQALPEDARPVMLWPNRDGVLERGGRHSNGDRGRARPALFAAELAVFPQYRSCVRYSLCF